MEYRICEADSAAKLQRMVNRLIQAGWRPTGGVAASPSSRSPRWWYYQAMTRDPEQTESLTAAAKPLAAGFGDFD